MFILAANSGVPTLSQSKKALPALPLTTHASYIATFKMADLPQLCAILSTTIELNFLHC